MGYFSKRNIFIYCCISACLSLITYLIAFSCEVSWILESKGNLPIPSYLLCTEFFILFISSAVLIHGLSTGVSWGLLCWSIIIGMLSVPELALVMYMTIQYWGLQSAHGLTELIGYLVRLIVNCLALLCVIPTALRWRQEKKVLAQLESLASRLQLTTPTPTTPFNATNGMNSLRASKRSQSSRRPSTGFDNPGYVPHETNSVDIVQQYTAYNNLYGSHSEFNASIFGLNPSQYIGPPPPELGTECKKTQSLLDLRFIFPPKFLTSNEKKNAKEKGTDETDSVLNNNLKNKINNKLNDTSNKASKDNNSVIDMNTDPTATNNDPIYYTIESTKNNKILGRNCVSLENLGNITLSESPLPYKKNDFAQYRYGNNLLKNYAQNPWNVIAYNPAYSAYPPAYFHYHMHPYQIYQMHHNNFPPTSTVPTAGGGGYFAHHQMQQHQYQPHHHHPGEPRVAYNTMHHSTISYGYNNAYLNSANNSRQSLGNESDDFRKYRDVAL
ncbi:asparagine-rich protein [Topomyia yanbarensis]|uniref:asparagine-rich protein n=1 Tax=Topomyia yanbarensis TaxID=2498891 RepID=UPI00273CD2CD|nr:asparagine-rich protein [Topomyia yanbarensis]